MLRARLRRMPSEPVQTDSAAEPQIDDTRAARFGSLLAVCLFAIALGCAGTPNAEPESEPEQVAAGAAYSDRRDADVYLVPVGACSKQYLVALADYYESEFGVRMGIAPALPYREGLYNPQRRQLATEPVLAWMMTKLDSYSTNPDSVFIGITHNDIYIATSNTRFAYAHHIPPHYAVVSSHRTSREPSDEIAEITEVQPGLRKLVTQAIGALHFERLVSTDPGNAMYGPLRELDDLEAIDESTARSALLE